jgi:hypothetical protein
MGLLLLIGRVERNGWDVFHTGWEVECWIVVVVVQTVVLREGWVLTVRDGFGFIVILFGFVIFLLRFIVVWFIGFFIMMVWGIVWVDRLDGLVYWRGRWRRVRLGMRLWVCTLSNLSHDRLKMRRKNLIK